MTGDTTPPLLAGTAQAQLAAMAAGETTAEALMQATLAQIARINGTVNAIVSLRDPDALLAEARAADAARAAGRACGALHGLPMAVKDLADVAGLETSMGSPILAGQVARRDELFVARLRAAGAIFIGKTNTPEFGLGSHTFNPVHGSTRNPWAPDHMGARTAGGSSGGAAVALATRMLALADGSDMMGSLRNPAGWGNVYGLRPSWGRVPALPEGETFLHNLSTNGPMARCPRDLALLLEVMAGPEPARPFCLPAEAFVAPLAADLRGRRIGWLGDWGGAFAMEDGILPLCEGALARFDALGVTVEPVAPPFPAPELWDSWMTLRAFANAARLGPLHADPARRAQLKAAAVWEVEQGQGLSLAQVEAASLIRSRWYARAAGLFDRYDALALPTAQVWPFPIDQEHPTQIAGRAMDTYHRWMEVVIPASLIGLPALAIPAGFGTWGPGAGLPMGVQLIGRHGDDLGLLQLAEGWHGITGGAETQMPPMLPGPQASG
ncbi:amidase [Rhodobaculum claviforme]|uniref:Amidase n=1 Tax=Rhodobaculum claviforme TaxID=1549854 RepID=A0A934TM96_9RHOB|nr:amidase [Rhodobaculum claviforme]MBK5928116.1 amidase [Rhodobaculum claviforme]